MVSSARPWRSAPLLTGGALLFTRYVSMATAVNLPGQVVVYRVVKTEIVKALGKRDETCPASYSLCPASLNGGCCSSGYTCGSDACYKSTTAPPSACGKENYFPCPSDVGGKWVNSGPDRPGAGQTLPIPSWSMIRNENRLADRTLPCRWLLSLWVHMQPVTELHRTAGIDRDRHLSHRLPGMSLAVQLWMLC